MKRAMGFGLALTLALSGCSGVRSGSSFTGPLPGSAVVGISWDASERLAELYPPGHTALYLAYPAEDKRRLDQRFSASSLKTTSAQKAFG